MTALLNTGNSDDNLLQDLKEDLLTYYRDNESMIPASPLVDEHKVPIDDLYVLPPLWSYDKPLNFKLDKSTRKEEQTSKHDKQGKKNTTISQLFVSDTNARNKKIYITANAGFGKTSLSQKLTMTWCQAHLPLTSFDEKYESDELYAMKCFDFLFLLHLREYQSELVCNLDDLIMLMLSKNMSRKTLYTKDFLQRLLHEKRCFILLDGLDEWAHPVKCNKTPAVPHNNHPNSCTVLTTSRPWKLGTIGLSEHNIDRHIEISELDWWTRLQLETKAVRILNERNLNIAEKNIEDFDKEVISVQIEVIINIPYILLQLMCLFFGGLSIGNSKCEVYSNIIEFTLQRGLNEMILPGIHVRSNDNASLPNCIHQNEKCSVYSNLILKLGRLALCTLFSEQKELSLIFDRESAKQFITEKEIGFCLKVGLLCQTKDNSIIAEKRYQVFFQHKSVQEFFSAIYVTSEWQNASVKATILKVCSSLASTLDMENLFVFVCGMNPEVYSCISGELQKNVDLDSVICRYTRRTAIHSDDDDDRKTMESYQSMQMQCLQESMRNGNESFPLYLHVVLMFPTEDYLTVLKTILHFNKGHVKSLLILYPDGKVAEFLQSLDHGVFIILRTLRVDNYDKEPVWLSDILTESARTLQSLTLSGYRCLLFDSSMMALTGLTCLQSLFLDRADMTHSNLKCLYAYISQTTTMTHLKLEYIVCSDHEYPYRDCDVTLNLHRLNKLEILHLDVIRCRELRVNPACLEKLEFQPWAEMSASASAILWQDLYGAPVLSSLTLYRMKSCKDMIQTFPTLTQLQYLTLWWIDMGGVIPRLPPPMTSLERVELHQVTMSSAAWRELFHSAGMIPRRITVKLEYITMPSQEWRYLLLRSSVLPFPVTVELNECKGFSVKEWTTFVDEIKTIPALSWIQDLRFKFHPDDDDKNCNDADNGDDDNNVAVASAAASAPGEEE